MIAAAIVCAAALSHGATADWAMGAKNIYNGTGGTEATDKYSGAAYFFDAGKMAQDTLYAYITEGKDITEATGYVATGVVASGVIAAATKGNTIGYGEQGAAGKVNWYFVLLEDDKVYFSSFKDGAYAAGTTPTSIAFGSQNDSKATFSATAPSGEGFAGAGKWSTVPEPTSGLLLLLGVAGLAPRRRRA